MSLMFHVQSGLFQKDNAPYHTAHIVQELFHKAFIESIICYIFTGWYGNGNVTIQFKAKLGHLVKTAMRITGKRDSLSVFRIFLLAISSR